MSLLADTDSYSIDALELGPMENFVYLIVDKKTHRAAVVDPAWDANAILQLAKQKGASITDILLTHSHHDHISGVDQILEACDARLHLLEAEARFSGLFQDSATLHHDGDIIHLGESEIKVLHTPGHTPGSACYHLGDHLITGDTLFVWGCGRCDLGGGNPEDMYESLRRLSTLPDSTLTLPGHNYSDQATATIAQQREGNPFLHFDDKAEFVEYRLHIHDRVRQGPYHAEPRKPVSGDV